MVSCLSPDLTRYASAVAQVVYIAFSLHQTLLFPCFFSPHKDAVYVLSGFVLLSFLEEGNAKIVLNSTLCGLVDCLCQTACLELVSRKH